MNGGKKTGRQEGRQAGGRGARCLLLLCAPLEYGLEQGGAPHKKVIVATRSGMRGRKKEVFR